MSYLGYASHFSERGLWEKIGSYARIAGAEVIEKSLFLWFALRKPEIPLWARATILGALGYFICPIDAIPDMMPFIGYADDLGVLIAALATVSAYVDEEVRQNAREKMREWFG